METGVLCVMMDGISMMPKLFVISLVSLEKVCVVIYVYICHLTFNFFYYCARLVFVCKSYVCIIIYTKSY